jgi:energy-coupling factor transporter ATP-binding protein EcfA2
MARRMTQYLTRAEFLDRYFDYRPGEHVSIIEPTGGGKSFLLRQLLGVAGRQHPHLRRVILMPKPRSESTQETARILNYGITPTWPPFRWPWQPERDGHIFWPPHQRGDAEANSKQLADKFRYVYNDLYWSGDSVTVADDMHIHAQLGLMAELERDWTAGREAGAAVWGANQKPSGTIRAPISTYFYNAPTHLFLGRDSDERNTRRFSEIGGIDPHEVRGIVRNLRINRIGGHAVSDKLYIDKRGPYMAVIGP